MSFVCILLSSQCRLSLVSVVFVFNASLNDVVPASPMSLSVYMPYKEKCELLMDVFCVSLVFCLHYSDRVQ